MSKGIFITFEGGEGSGKSTHIKAACQFFLKKKYRVLLLREPGGTLISEKIRQILLDPKNNTMTKECELLLYVAARAQLVKEKVMPALQQGKVVILDRFEDSTMAYQGFGAGISLKWIKALSVFARGSLSPDLTIVLDVDPAQGLRRGGRHDRVEKKSDAFHVRVRKGFRFIARSNPKRVKFISASRPMETVRNDLLRCLDHAFS